MDNILRIRNIIMKHLKNKKLLSVIILTLSVVTISILYFLQDKQDQSHKESEKTNTEEVTYINKSLQNSSLSISIPENWTQKSEVITSEENSVRQSFHIIEGSNFTIRIIELDYKESPEFENITGGTPVHITWSKSEMLPELTEVGELDGKSVYFNLEERGGVVFADYGEDRVTDEMDLWTDTKEDKVSILFFIKPEVPDEEIPDKIEEIKKVILSLRGAKKE